jgi:hypothetical protein
MTIEKAVQLLYERFQATPWFTMAGIGEDQGRQCIVLYVKSPASVPSHLKDGWCGFPVMIRKMSAPRPIRTLRMPRAAG